ncbi:MAG: heat-inducible transcriptional repressor HrcA [Candidatus Aminicenantes bacterium]|nr:heat-inducible transcriptional repressor HrcA [Candidatus Aminicenantes bacterium]
MMGHLLKEKEKIVLHSLVESYLQLGRPISSGHIVSLKVIKASPATIRNIMAKLERLGYLYQPHTSAGRIPTDKGLRFYVNCLLEKCQPAKDSFLRGGPEIWPTEGHLDSLFFQASRVLAEHSHNLGFVLSPPLSKLIFHHLRFLLISENRVLIILTTANNLVFTDIVQTEEKFTQSELDRAAFYINQNFRFRNLVFVRDYLLRELPRVRWKYEDLLSKMLDLLKASTSRIEEKSRIFIQGAANLLEKSQFFSLEKLRSLFQDFEEKARLVRFLSELINLDRVKVLIGSEVDLLDISDCSLVVSNYGYENQVLGTVGIIGPKRIPYGEIIPLVEKVAYRLSLALRQSH